MAVYYPQCRVNLWLLPEGKESTLDNLLPIEAIVPVSAEVQRNSVNKADTFSVDLDATFFPIDPKGVRTTLVSVHMQDMGDAGKVLNTRTAESRLIIGHADKVDVDRDKGIISLEGRDYTALLLDPAWSDTGLGKLELGRGLDVIVQEVLDSVASAAALDVAVLMLGDAPIVPAGKGKKGRYHVPDNKTSPWEVLHGLAQQIGAILAIDGDTVVIRRPETVVAGSQRVLPVFVDGVNLEGLKLARNFDDKDLPNVRVKATDPQTRGLMSATWPDPPNKDIRIARGKRGTKREETISYHNYTIDHPAPTEELLEVVARRVYEGWRQQQLSVEFSTAELEVLQTRTSGPLEDAERGFDVSRLKNGTPIRLHIDRQTRNVLERAKTPEAKELELLQLGYRGQVAKALASTWRSLDRTFYTESCTHRYSADEGYSLDVSAINAVEV